VNADGFIRACEKNGEMLVIRRLTGTRQTAFSVECLGCVRKGIESALVGNVQQTTDVIQVSDREMRAAQWPAPPRQGDQIVYGNGAVRTIMANVQHDRLDEDTVFTIKTLGG
jgi:hypothetical protein